MLKLTVYGQSISCEYPPTASDSIDYLTAFFSFSPEWYGLTKTAQFTQNNKTYSVVLEKDKCTLPAEITAGALEISVFGQQGGSALRITTLSCTVNIRKSGFRPDGENPIPPTPDLYSQLIARVDEAVKSIPEVPEIPTVLSAFTDDVGYAKTSDIPEIPTNLSAFANDAGYAKTSDIPEVPTNLSAFTDDVGYAKTSEIPQIPTNISAFTDDVGYAKTSDIPEVPTNISAFTNDVGYAKVADIPASPDYGILKFDGDEYSAVIDAVNENEPYNSKLTICSYAITISGYSLNFGFSEPVKGLMVGTPEEDFDPVNKKYIDDMFGDVESALDGILAIQQSLMGGETA